MKNPKKTKIIIFCIILAVLITYTASYLGLRHHRLSIDYIGSRMIFESTEQASEWNARFTTHQADSSLIYDDSNVLYVVFWPAIQIDSATTGRSIDSPHDSLKYSVPKNK